MSKQCNPTSDKDTMSERERKQSGKKSKKEKLPHYRIGDEVVVCMEGRSSNIYGLIQIVDWRSCDFGDFVFYGKLLKITGRKYLRDIGHLFHFVDKEWSFINMIPANVENKGIKWVEK